MRVSFNGARRNIAMAFNDVVRDPSPDNLNDLRNVIVGFLCMYDDNVKGDFDNLIDDIKLVDVLDEDGFPAEEFGG